MKAGYSLAHVRSWQILQCFGSPVHCIPGYSKPLVAMLFSLEGRSNTQFIYSISSQYSFVINSYQEILLETSKQKMFNLKFKNIYALFVLGTNNFESFPHILFLLSQ